MDLKDIELESVDWIDLEIRQTSSQTKYNFRDNSSERSPQRDTQHLPHGMNSHHLATAPPGASYLQPPYAAVHHDTIFRIVNTKSKTQ